MAMQQPRLGEFLRSQQDDIIGAWMPRIRKVLERRGLSDVTLVDHLPQILARVSEIMTTSDAADDLSFAELPESHAVARLDRDFDLDEVVTEYAVLRRTIVSLWQERVAPAIDTVELRAFDAALDGFVREAVRCYMRHRERLLRALDRMSAAALGSADLDALLNHLLEAMIGSSEVVDTGAVLLSEGGRLRVRGAIGVEAERSEAFSVAIGEGFPGHVAVEARPLFWADAAADPRVKNPALREAGVRALYGVPLVHRGAVIGVAQIGSMRAAEFPPEDMLLFRTMVNRATEAIFQHVLRQEADARALERQRAEEEQRFLKEASAALASSLDYRDTLSRVAALAIPALGDWCVVDVLEEGRVRRVSSAHVDAARAGQMARLAEHYPPDANAPSGVGSVLRTGRTEWEAEVTPDRLAAVSRGDEHLALLRALGVESYLIVPIRLRDRVLGAMTIVAGDSHRRYTERDVRVAEEFADRAANAIEHGRLYAEAQHAIQMRERVLAIVSHDLRNHLGLVGVAASLLNAKAAALPGGEGLLKSIGTIQRTTENMVTLVGDLVDMASIEAGRLSVVRGPEDLGGLLIESCERHQPAARDKGVTLKADVDGVGGIDVLCDRNRILQVLLNLVGNAIKFCRQGDVVTLRGEARDQDALVAVRDTGPGIPPEQLEVIFQPYRTISREGQGGTGLGLYIAHGIIRGHGGRLWAESMPGRGTTFFFTLPR